MKVLVTADLDRKIEKEFPELSFTFFGYALNEHIPASHNDLKKIISSYDFLISEFDTIDKEIIDSAHELKMIICCRGGVNTVIDVQYAAENGIIVRNTPGRNASSVAEYVLGVIIENDRHLIEANESVLSDTLQHEHYYLPEKYKDSLWGMDNNAPYHKFRGKGLHKITLGVIGYGNVGRVVVSYAVLLGIHVLIYNDHPIISPIPAGVKVVDKDYLLKNSDYISLHCNNRMHQIVMGFKEFEKMPSNSYFINTARGDLVDEKALIKALDNGIIRGAAIDVTSKEPLPPDDPLIKARNIFITPHIAGATEEVIEVGTDMVIYHLREYLSNIWKD